MKTSRWVIQGPQLVLKCTAAIIWLFCCAVTGNGKFDTIFVIGDSYVDNGNRDPNNSTYTAIGRVNQDWTPPYGRTNPGIPAGRFSDGKVLSDYLADYIGLKPRPYRVLSIPSTSTNALQGINFAVGGAGVLDNLGFTKSPDQIKQLQAVLSSGLYNASVYSKSVILYEISGNDYAAILRNSGNDVLELHLTPTFTSRKAIAVLEAVPQIVQQMTADLQAMYALGFRNFVVGKLAPLGCIPSQAYQLSYLACFEPANDLALYHNELLQEQVTLSLPSDAKVLFLDSYLAFSTVVYNFTNPGRLKPCCTGQQNGVLCGDLDSAGNALYTLCNVNSQKNYFFWDEFHPTEAGWGVIFNLFKQALYTGGLVSLNTFLGL